MRDLIDSLSVHFAGFIELLPVIAVVALVGLVAGRLCIAWVIKRHQRWKNYREVRGWTPASWISAEPRAHFDAESALLANRAIRELYAPSSQFIRDLNPNERAKEWAGFSAYPRAVRAAIKDNRGMGKGKKLDARKQIADAARHIIVRDLPAGHKVVELEVEVIPEDETDQQRERREAKNERKLRENHFRIDLTLDGRAPEEVRKLEGRIVSQLGLHSLVEIETEDNFTLSYAAHRTPPGDPLAKVKIGVQFLKDNVAKVAHLIPLAVRESGALWALAMHHLLIIGMTGSGKGSPLNALIRQLAHFVEGKTVVLYGIDPKASELRPYEESRLFKEIVYENADAMDVIAEVHKAMKHRAKHKRVDVANADLGRSLDATRENPMIVLMIDEFLSLLIALQSLGRDGKASMTLLTEILAQGRSLGVFVVAATQEADKDLLGRMRGNFANTILLKQPSDYFNDLFLGEGAKAAGFDSTAIPLSTKANGYAYAGIGFVKEETGKPVKVRFPYSSDEDIAELIQMYPKEGSGTASAGISRGAQPEPFAIGGDDDDEGGFEFETLTLDDPDGGDSFDRF